MDHRDKDRERRIAGLLGHLPPGIRRRIEQLRRPEAKFARIAAGIGFCLGGLMFFLPVLGLWMLPIGLILLSEDVPMLRSMTDRGMAWAEGRWPGAFRAR